MRTLAELFYNMVVLTLIGNEVYDFTDGYQVFNHEAGGVDDLPTVYSKNGVVLKVCHDCGYFVILGLNNEDFSKIKKVYKGHVSVVTSEQEQEEVNKIFNELKEGLN